MHVERYPVLLLRVYCGRDMVELTPEIARQLLALKQQGIKPPAVVMEQAHIAAMDIKTWAETYYYIPETQQPVRLEPLQEVIFNFFLDTRALPPFGFTEMLWTSLKKSAKTASAGIMARFIAETWGFKQEIYVLANDEEQAKGRIYQSIKSSIELDPDYDRVKRQLVKNGRVIWRIVENLLTHVPTDSSITVVNIDYRGAAGGNPSATFFSELWGYTRDSHRKTFDELTPVPTRTRSIRWIETYAGFEGESLLLREIWDRAEKQGRRVTREELEPYGGWPYDDPDDEIPLWIHEPSRMLAYIDQIKPGKPPYARRMPWLQGEFGDAYYAQQASTLLPDQYDRFHRNLWQNAQAAFMDVQSYYACYDPDLPALTPGSREICVIGVDASVSNDCTAAVLMTRHPNDITRPAMRMYKVWYPPRGGKLDYGAPEGLEETLRSWIKAYNIQKIVYDEYQLNDMMHRFRREDLAACHVFSQGADRMVADKMLYDVILQRRFAQRDTDGRIETEFATQLRGASRQMAPKEDTKLRIVKSVSNTAATGSAAASKIDVLVAASMANHAIMGLLL